MPYWIGDNDGNPENVYPDCIYMNSLYTVKEVAAALKLRWITVYGYVKRNELPYVRLRRRIRITDKQLNEFIASHIINKKEEPCKTKK